MSWKQWPFHPRSLTQMIGPRDRVADRERFISLLVSGWCETLSRPLTILEPVLDESGEPIEELIDENSGETRLVLRRIDHVNPREHFASFCVHLRDLPGQEKTCQRWDEDVARQVIQAAYETPEKLEEFVRGYPSLAHLIGQASPILFDRTPVAVVISGQFLPDDEEERQNLVNFIGTLKEMEEEQQELLLLDVGKLETRDEFVQRYIDEMEQRNSEAAAKLREEQPTAAVLFSRAVNEVKSVASAQYQMHKRELEGSFRNALRQSFTFLTTGGRAEIADQMQPILKKVCDFCGAQYLALFVSPRRYISYEGNPDLLTPFVFMGMDDGIQAGINHFNWRRAGFSSEYTTSLVEGSDAAPFSTKPPFLKLWINRRDIKRLLDRSLKGEATDFFSNATILCQMHLSGEYRSVLLWGPFSHLPSQELEQERPFLEEVSELVMMRALSSAQLSDLEARTNTWSEVATLLSHYSRRVMQPVLTGIRIIADYIQGGKIYSREEALKALGSLDAASILIQRAVRAPVFSFAAVTEQTYEFSHVSLASIVEECVALYEPIAREKDIRINVYPSVAELPIVEADRAKIAEAIGYVLDNAIKYSHDGREVRIYKGEKEGTFGKRAQLYIEDFGQGIVEDEKNLIFMRGYRGRRSRKAIREEGEGMGLFHARRIIEAHRGRMWCDCHSGQRYKNSMPLAGYLVWFVIELPIEQPER